MPTVYGVGRHAERHVATDGVSQFEVTIVMGV